MRKPPFALVFHPEQERAEGRLLQTPMAILERCVPTAEAQDWIVLARDSDVVAPGVNLNLQSNPVRRHDDSDYRKGAVRE